MGSSKMCLCVVEDELGAVLCHPGVPEAHPCQHEEWRVAVQGHQVQPDSVPSVCPSVWHYVNWNYSSQWGCSNVFGPEGAPCPWSPSLQRLCRLIVFKILAQSVILGCTWVLGLYQANLFFQVLFILLNSQQGTFLFIVHCLLNKEVGPNQEPLLWFIFIQDHKNRTMLIELVYW